MRESLRLKVKVGHSYNLKELWIEIVLLDSFWLNFSALFVLIITIEHYIHMKHDILYRELITKERVIVLMVFNVISRFHIAELVILLPVYQGKFPL